MLNEHISLEEFSFSYLVSPEDLIKKYEEDFGLNVSFKKALSKSRLLNLTNTKDNLELENKLLKDIKKYNLEEEALNVESVAIGSTEYNLIAMDLYKLLVKISSKDYCLNQKQHVEDLFSSNKNPMNKICVVEILKETDKVIGIDFIAKEISGSVWIRSTRLVSEFFDMDYKDFLLTANNGRLQIIFKSNQFLSVYANVLNDLKKGVFTEVNVPKLIIGKTVEDTLVYKDLKSKGIHILGKTGSGKSTFVQAIVDSLMYLNSNEKFKIENISRDFENNINITAKTAYYKLVNSFYQRIQDVESISKDEYEKLPYLVFVLDEFRFLGSNNSETEEYHVKLKELLAEMSISAEKLKLFFISSSFNDKGVSSKYLENIGNVISISEFDTIGEYNVPKIVSQQYHALITKQRYALLKDCNEFSAVKPVYDFKSYSTMEK